MTTTQITVTFVIRCIVSSEYQPLCEYSIVSIACLRGPRSSLITETIITPFLDEINRLQNVFESVIDS